MNRVELQNLLEALLGSRNVYFQPPESVRMSYPAIVYSLNSIDHNAANNSKYLYHRSYTVTLIDKNPDSVFIDKLLALPFCRFDRHYVSDNLNHYIFSIYCN